MYNNYKAIVFFQSLKHFKNQLKFLPLWHDTLLIYIFVSTNVVQTETMEIEDTLKISRELDLPSKTLINIQYTSRLLEEKFAALLKEFDLSTPQFNVLRILRGQKGKPASLACIQERMVDRSSNTTRLVDKLISKGLVERRICPANRRKVEIEITKPGLILLKELDPLTTKTNAESAANLTQDELLTLNNLLDKLRNDE
ncbi:MarR family winged helix-turn-helix transcriptional regulator [Leeuwenhoekiella marinoflava]|nr:MarR family transcriptional regulator [Leeuwenhoekiella marinoflava]